MLYTARPLTIWVRPSLESSRLRELLKGQNSREDTVVKITKNLLEKSVGPPNGVGLESLFTGEAGIYQPSLGSLITDLRGAIPYRLE